VTVKTSRGNSYSSKVEHVSYVYITFSDGLKSIYFSLFEY